MKRILTTLAAVGLAVPAFADSYSVFKVCEDHHVIRTADGADAGHIEYIVVEPGSHRVVSTIATGGVLAERHVAIPVSAIQYRGDREIVLQNIDRERIVSAPAIETTRITSSSFDPGLLERSTTFFRGGGSDVNIDRSRTTVGERSMDRTRGAADRAGSATVTTPGAGVDSAEAARSGTSATASPEAARGAKHLKNQRKGDASSQPDATGADAASATTPSASGSSKAAAPESDAAAADRTSSKSERSMDKAGQKADRTLDKANEKASRTQDKASEKADRASEKSQSEPASSGSSSKSHDSGASTKADVGGGSPSSRSAGGSSSAEKSSSSKE